MGKYIDKLKSLIKKERKENERTENQKKVRGRGVAGNSKSFPVLSGKSPSLPDLRQNLHPYKLYKQYKKGSFMGFVVKHNRRKRPYRGFVSVRIWEAYVSPGEHPTAKKIDFMIEVSEMLREGYQPPPEVLPVDGGGNSVSPPDLSEGEQGTPAGNVMPFPSRTGN